MPLFEAGAVCLVGAAEPAHFQSGPLRNVPHQPLHVNGAEVVVVPPHVPHAAVSTGEALVAVAHRALDGINLTPLDFTSVCEDDFFTWT